MTVDKQCLVSFSIRKQFCDEVLCDIVKMDACHLLLGRPWQFVRETQHDGKKNSYNLVKDDKRFTLLRQKQKHNAKSSTPNSSFLVTKSFVNEILELGVVFMLLSALELDAMNIPTKIRQLILQFEDVFPIELPSDLPPMRDI